MRVADKGVVVTEGADLAVVEEEVIDVVMFVVVNLGGVVEEDLLMNDLRFSTYHRSDLDYRS